MLSRRSDVSRQGRSVPWSIMHKRIMVKIGGSKKKRKLIKNRKLNENRRRIYTLFGNREQEIYIFLEIGRIPNKHYWLRGGWTPLDRGSLFPMLLFSSSVYRNAYLESVGSNSFCERAHGADASHIHMRLTLPPPCGRHKWLTHTHFGLQVSTRESVIISVEAT